jgi:hypothetical protein
MLPGSGCKRCRVGPDLLQAGDNPAPILPALDHIRDRFLATGRKTAAALGLARRGHAPRRRLP